MDLSEATSRIKAAGPRNVRIVPMPGQEVVTGLHQVMVQEGGKWVTVLENVPKEMAESLVSSTGKSVILG